MAKELRDTGAGGYTSKPHSAPMPEYNGFNVRENQFQYQPTSLNIPQAKDSGVLAIIGGASSRLDHIAAKFQAEQDDARVTAAITDLRRHATDLEAGENGWRKLLQANALEPDKEGKGLVERVDTDMRAYGDQLGEGLTGRQRRMFQRHAMNVYQSVYGGVSSHVVTQGMEYQKGVYSSAIDFEIEAAATNGFKLDALQGGEQRLLENADKLANLLGIPDDQRQNFKRKYTSALYANAIDGIMSQSMSNPSLGFTALGLLRKNAHKMTGSDVNRLRRSIDQAVQESQAQSRVDELTEEASGYIAMQDGAKVRSVQESHGVVLKATPGDATATEDFTIGILEGQKRLQTDTSEVMHDGKNFSAKSRYGASNVSLENAYELDKNVDSQKLLNDKAYNIEVGRNVYAKCLTEFAGDKQMAFAAYFSSPSEVKAAQKAAEQATDGTGNWFDKMPKNVQEKVAKSMQALDDYSGTALRGADGQTVNSFTPQAFKLQKLWLSPVQLEKWFLEKDGRARTDPSYRNNVLNRLIAKQNRLKLEYTQQQENLLASVTDTLYANGGDLSSVPPQDWAQLTRKQQMDAMEISKKILKGEDTTNPAVAALYADDENLRALSSQGLNTLRSSFSAKDYEVLRGRWYKVQAAGRTVQEQTELARISGVQGVALAEYTPPSGLVSKALEAVPVYAKLKEKHPTEAKNVVQNFMTAIAIEGQTSGKGPITKELDVISAVNRMTNAMGGADPDKVVTLFGHKASKLPDEGLTDVYEISRAQARIRYGHDPSDLETLNTARDIYFNRYAVVDLRGQALDEAVVKKAREKFRAYKGRDPQGAELIRLYFMVRFSGEEVENLKGFSETTPNSF